MTDPRLVVLGCDPGRSRGTGLGVVDLTGEIIARRAVNIDRAGFSQNDAVDILDAMIPHDALWAACIETPPPVKRGSKSAPIGARDFWIAAIDQLARRRSVRAGRPAKGPGFHAPMIVKVEPSPWRIDLGLPIAAPRHIVKPNDRAKWLKAEIVKRLTQRLGIVFESDDEAEGVGIAVWAAKRIAVHRAWVHPAKRNKPIKTEELAWVA